MSKLFLIKQSGLDNSCCLSLKMETLSKPEMSHFLFVQLW